MMIMQKVGGWLSRLLYKIFGSANDRIIASMMPEVAEINAFEPGIRLLTDEQLKDKTAEFKGRLAEGATLDDILCEAFAVCREASCRTLGMRHFDVQLVGGMILHSGRIAEMITGEGKTLVSTLAAYLNALEGQGVHVVTVNDYLAQRDRDWNAPLFEALGMTVGCIQSEMMPSQRIPEYACDVTYGTNNEFGFDYLRDNMKVRLEDQCQKRQRFAIIDEVDSVLIDEARTPLIISGPAEMDTSKYYDACKVARKLVPGDHFEIKEKEHQCLMSEAGMNAAEKLAGVDTFYSGANMEWPHLVETALRARHLYKKDKDYVVERGEVIIVDEFTGRKMSGRRWSDGLHQAVEAKEGLKIQRESQTLATITFQNFFRLYDKLSGMTGTALTEAGEFDKIYKLDVVAVPTNRPLIRKNYDDVIYIKEKEKYNAMVEEIVEVHKIGRPVLVGTTSIEKSERIADMLVRRGVTHEVLNAKNHEREASIVAKAGFEGSVTIATNMAGRGTDIVLGPGVLGKGGLHIVGTERHESRRIDNQLRGRAGRQGDPGSSRFFLSLEDDLMRIFAGPMVRNLMGRLADDNMDIQHPMVSRAIARAQKKVESHNFEIRKNLLEYDKVMDEQRKIVYDMRNKVLRGEDTRSEVLAWLILRTSSAVDRFLPESVRVDDWDYEGLSEFLKTRYDIELSDADLRDRTGRGKVRDLVDDLEEMARKKYDEREQAMGEERMRDLEQFLMLNAIDTKWKDHLYAMDVLRDGIGLEGYGGKDPKVMYKSKGYQFFDEMIQLIHEEVGDMILRLEYEESDAARLGRTWDAQEFRHDETSGYASHQAQVDAAMAAASSEAPKPIRRKGKKIGRNDPCYCGSGKKYKKCHGAQ